MKKFLSLMVVFVIASTFVLADEYGEGGEPVKIAVTNSVLVDQTVEGAGRPPFMTDPPLNPGPSICIIQEAGGNLKNEE